VTCDRLSRRLSALEQPLNRAKHHRHFVRALLNNGICAGFGLIQSERIREPGNQDDWHISARRPDLRNKLRAVHVWHTVIRNNQIEGLVREAL
jgi:hypothetical protein